AADAVGHRTEAEGAEHDTDLARGEENADRRRFEMQAVAKSGHCDADDLDVVAVHGGGEKAEQENPDLIGAERILVDQLFSVDPLCHGRFPPNITRWPPRP